MEAEIPDGKGETPPRKRSRWHWWLRAIVWGLGGLVSLFLLLAIMEPYMFQVPYLLGFGWIHYLAQVIPMVRMNFGMLFTGIALFVLAAALSHVVLGWVWRQRKRDQAWSWKWTLWVSLWVPLLFGVSIAAGGIIHQAGWILREPRWVEWVGRGGMTKNMSNARQVITALRIWASENKGVYPKRLDQLFTDAALDNPRILYYVSANGETPELFVYLTGLTDSDPASLPLVIGPHGESRDRWIVGRNDASVAVVKSEEAAQAIAEWREYTHHR